MSSPIEPIAIVGMAGRFPGAQDVEQFWSNLRDGRTGLRTLTDEELAAAGVLPEELADDRYVRVNGDAPEVDMFDAAFFGMTPREAAVCDPQLRIFLETAHAAMENAGYDNTAITDVGVYAGVGHSLYWDHNLRLAATSAGSRDLTAGIFNYPDYVSTLVSYKLNLTGPSMTVLTACSSSLLTLHLAIQALHSGECEMALAGGTDLEMLGHGYTFAEGGPLSRDGRCRSFDANASGTVFSSGVGVVVVKRLSDALADGDDIRAVVRATAANNDGSDKVGFSAPSVSGQTAVAMEALALAGVAPEDVGYVEAHGTGTPLGDPIEFSALNEAFRRLASDRTLPAGYCGLGSVKSSVGHLGHAAGVASLIKMVLCLEREHLAPTLHVDQPNPKLDWESSPFSLVTEPRPWPRTPGRPRIASINSLGFGGTNVHAVLEEAPLREPAPQADDRPRLMVWSARTAAAEEAYRPALSAHLAGSGAETFADTLATLQEGRTAHPVRAAAVVDSAVDARAVLDEQPERIIGSGSPVRKRPVVFVFPGQGSQHAGTARGLYGTDPTFTQVFDECLDALAAAGSDLRAAWQSGDDAALEPTEVAQPLLFAVEYALARMWMSWGIKPRTLLGHSIGELVAAAVAGVFTPADAARLVVARGTAMAAMPPGDMLAVRLNADEVADLLPDGVVVAAVNGPGQTIVSGPPEAVGEALRRLTAAGVSARPVRTSHAFHSPSMAPAAETFAAAFAGIEARAPEIPLYSAATAAPLTAAEAADPAFWAGQLTAPVRFGDAADALLADGDVVLLEVGPERVLTSVLGAHPAVREGRHVVVPTLPRRGVAPADDLRSALAALGALWTEGHPVDWPAVRDGVPLRRVPLPGYRYQRSRHWIDARPETAAPAVVETPAGIVEELPPAPAAPFATLSWVEQAATAGPAYGGVPTVALLPEDDTIALPLVLALQQAGLRIVPVRPGNEFRDEGVEFRVRPGRTADLERLLRTLADRGRSPRLLVHAWSAKDWEAPSPATTGEQLDLSCHSLVDLVQWGARAAGTGPAPGLIVLTSRSLDVSGGEPVDPVKATLHGLVRTMALEAPEQTSRLIDVGTGVTEDELVAELCAVGGEPVVALRRDRRWVRAERPYAPVAGPERVLRRDGVYLITGGLGGLGLELAKGIARLGLRPRLALVGRTDPAADGEAGARAGTVRAALSELAMLGAEVRVFPADVADARAMRRVADTVTARFGPVNGVFHLAGVPGDGMLLFRDRAAMAEVLRPKVLGTLVLAEVFAGRPALDFVVAFSSRAAVDGLVGSGDYAAANAFLDAYAPTSSLARGRVISVGWPSWSRVGMAAEPPQPPRRPGVRSAETVLAAEEQPFLDEHRINGAPVLPGTGIIDFVYRSFLQEVPEPERPGSVRLSDVVLRTPLVCAQPRRVTVEFEPQEPGWSFTVRSVPVAGGTEVTHVTGEIGTVTVAAPEVDLTALLARLTDRQGPERTNGPNRLFTLGPRWQNLVEIASPADGGGDEKVAVVELPEAFTDDLVHHPLHPSIMDTALSSARDPRRDGLSLPFMYRSLTVHGPLPRRVYSHIVRRPASDRMIVADITICDPDGRVVVECEGFTLRTVQRDYLGDQPGTAAPAAPAEPLALAPGSGIDPEVGVELLVGLLRSRPVRHVAVRPFRDGQPVPLAGPALVPAVASALPAPVAVVPAPAQASAAPVAPQPAAETPTGDDPVVERTRRLWGAVLGTTAIRTSDDFFDLGGNSLAAIDLVTLVRKEFGVELNVAMLFDYPTLGALSDALRAQGVTS
ncbi:type I polyketide synthase [Micromonospora sp. RTGN7]|uniref:type I polyketide synthase n=1 Tax=Micromonospora sp. RTGN7 TaxID=3016526 RepID=UPI0029FF3EC6|nr:type I polyketide synthase [Micromonospora sp. RTGN7]